MDCRVKPGNDELKDVSLTRHHPRKRVIQYSRGADDQTEKSRRTGYPLEPVIGLAAGETRWRV
jgi:hypothetical protein